ncbi:MAG: hypothetical protein HUU02_11150 [Bacteroidetes bacterium]|nr:hypothetical protein [Bacteroidota bacterium]
MKTPLFTGLLLGGIFHTVVQDRTGMWDIVLLIVFTLLFVLPFLYRRPITAAISSFLSELHPFGRTLLVLHGLFFLAVLQPFALLWTADLLLPHSLTVSHSVLLTGMTVIAGAFAVLAPSSMTRMIARWSAVGVTGLILILSVNSIFLTAPLLPHPVRFFGSAVDGGVGVKFLMLAASGVLAFWLVWMEQSAMDEQKEARFPMEPAAALLVILLATAVTMLPIGGDRPVQLPLLQEMSNVLTGLMVAGTAGLFSGTVSAAGRMVSEHVYPQFDRTVAADKQQLAGKLSVVFSVVVSVLLIPVIRTMSVDQPEQYIAALAAFVAPVVAAFLLFVVVRKRQPFVLAVSMMLGGLAVLPAFIVSLLTAGNGGAGLFLLSVRGAVVTAVSYAVLGVLKEFVVVQRLLSLLRQS